MKTSGDFQDLFSSELLKREATAEKFTCIIWIALIATTYSLFMLATDGLSPLLVRNITGLVAVTIPAFAIILILIQKGFYSSWLRYLNSFLQVSLVSAAIFFDIQAYGIQYALSSMPPMAYGLVLVVTAFRLRPLMGIFAGLVAATEFGLIYAYFARTSGELDADLLTRLPSLSWAVTGMKILVLVALGAACSFAAYRVRKQLILLIGEAVRQNQLRSTLDRYVSPEVAQEIIETNEGRIPTRMVSAVVMFGDVRGFTQFSSQRDPKDVVAVLNDVFETVNETVSPHGGILNKFLGDGFLALFGIYGNDPHPHQTAVKAAFEMLEKTSKQLAPFGLQMGIAINAGDVIVGEVGSDGRCEFTAIGAPVNVASRIEAFNRTLGTQLLVPSTLLENLGDLKLSSKSHGTHTIRGVPTEIELIELKPDTHCS